MIENDVFLAGLRGCWENVSLSYWGKLCTDANIILDIGANTGLYSLVAKTLHPTSEIYAFEPVERVYDKLVKNVKLNNYSIHCINEALSNHDGTGIIYDPESEHVYSVTVNKNLAPADVKVIEQEIRIKKLSSFIDERNIPKIDLIKMDVETHEVEVLEGMGKYLKEFQPDMIIEILDSNIGMKIEGLIKDCNYLYFSIDEKSKPQKIEHLNQGASGNYLICSAPSAKKLCLI